mmetsp:Transcript_5626/g.19830  ORF Transcript_5626/g.19830 Transcript_5626/m.19830 type:complete len:208 (-) Transcript_5626:679-1302(-)
MRHTKDLLQRNFSLRLGANTFVLLVHFLQPYDLAEDVSCLSQIVFSQIDANKQSLNKFTEEWFIDVLKEPVAGHTGCLDLVVGNSRIITEFFLNLTMPWLHSLLEVWFFPLLFSLMTSRRPLLVVAIIFHNLEPGLLRLVLSLANLHVLKSCLLLLLLVIDWLHVPSRPYALGVGSTGSRSLVQALFLLLVPYHPGFLSKGLLISTL